jgi:2-C-methyl-D-erythritol 4-phosphate cytidylyltransferase
MKVVVIIPAAGLGTRMAPIPAGAKGKRKKAPPSKQFTELGGTPILLHTLRKFAAVDAVSEIWIALRENEIAGFRAQLESEATGRRWRAPSAIGGERAESCCRGAG